MKRKSLLGWVLILGYQLGGSVSLFIAIETTLTLMDERWFRQLWHQPLLLPLATTFAVAWLGFFAIVIFDLIILYKGKAWFDNILYEKKGLKP